jgi:hypothetical protein
MHPHGSLEIYCKTHLGVYANISSHVSRTSSHNCLSPSCASEEIYTVSPCCCEIGVRQPLPPARIVFNEMARDIRRTARQAASQGRSQYLEPDTDDDFEMEDVYAPSPIAERAPPTKRQRRSNTGRRSVYTEPNTDDEFEASDESFHHPTATRAPKSTDRSTGVALASKTPARAQRRNRAQNRARTSTTRGIQPLGRPRRANSQAVQEQKSRAFSGPSDNSIPPWASLPVDILKDIFVYSVARENKHLRSPEARCVR